MGLFFKNNGKTGSDKPNNDKPIIRIVAAITAATTTTDNGAATQAETDYMTCLYDLTKDILPGHTWYRFGVHYHAFYHLISAGHETPQERWKNGILPDDVYEALHRGLAPLLEEYTVNQDGKQVYIPNARHPIVDSRKFTLEWLQQYKSQLKTNVSAQFGITAPETIEEKSVTAATPDPAPALA